MAVTVVNGQEVTVSVDSLSFVQMSSVSDVTLSVNPSTVMATDTVNGSVVKVTNDKVSVRVAIGKVCVVVVSKSMVMTVLTT